MKNVKVIWHMKINAQSKRLGNYHASVGSLEVKVKYFGQHTYFCIICRSRTETSLLFLLMSDSKFCICSAVNFILWGFSNSQTKGRPRPRVLTSTSSRPEAENLIPTQINEWPQVSCGNNLYKRLNIWRKVPESYVQIELTQLNAYRPHGHNENLYLK